MKKVNRGTITDVPWWYNTWQPSGYSPTRAKPNLPRRPRANEVPGAEEEIKSHLHWQFLGMWQVLRGIILEIVVRQHHTDQKPNGLLKEQCAE